MCGCRPGASRRSRAPAAHGARSRRPPQSGRQRRRRTHEWPTAARHAPSRGAALQGHGSVEPAVVPGQGRAPRIENRTADRFTGTEDTPPPPASPERGDTDAGRFGAVAWDKSAHDTASGGEPSGTRPRGDDGTQTPGAGPRKGTPLRGTDVPPGLRRRGGLSAWARRLTGGRGEQTAARGTRRTTRRRPWRHTTAGPAPPRRPPAPGGLARPGGAAADGARPGPPAVGARPRAPGGAHGAARHGGPDGPRRLGAAARGAGDGRTA